jgi:uncharacterized protein (DUF1684 family)
MSFLETFRHEKDEFLRHDPHSPLTPEQREGFAGLQYFSEDPDLDLKLEIDEFPEKKTVTMQTTTGDVQDYVRYGRLRFNVAGEEVELTLFHNRPRSCPMVACTLISTWPTTPTAPTTSSTHARLPPPRTD